MNKEALEVELKRLTDGMPRMQAVLLIATAFSEVYGGEWNIEATEDGGIRARFKDEQ
jgi:hypothetical protein